MAPPETFCVLSGRLRLTIGGETAELDGGDAAVASARSEPGVANTTDQPAHMWVSTRAGLSAELADGCTITPPWTHEAHRGLPAADHIGRLDAV